MSRYFARDGSPMTLEDWAVSFDWQDRRVAETTLADKRWVSTVHLGLDHRFGDGPPLIFETMVFPPDSSSDLYCERYSTEDEAKDGHARIVAECEQGKHK